MNNIQLMMCISSKSFLSGFMVAIISLLVSIFTLQYIALAQPDNDKFNSYANPAEGIEILYPSYLQKLGQDTAPPVNGSSVVIFSFPHENDPYIWEEYINISSESVKNLTLDEYTNIMRAKIINNTHAKIFDDIPIKLAGNDAHQMRFLLDQENKMLDVTDNWTIKNGKAYRITFYSVRLNDPGYDEIVQTVLESFKITR
jgi:hypothetical protein